MEQYFPAPGPTKTEFDGLSAQIANIPASTTCNSLDDVKTYLTSVMNSMSDNQIKTVHILTGSSFSGGYFKSSIRYSGHVVRFASGQISFDFNSRGGDIVNGGLLSTTWTFTSLSDQIGDKANMIKQSLSGNASYTGIAYPCFIVGGRQAAYADAYVAFVDVVGAIQVIKSSNVFTVSIESNAVKITNNTGVTTSFIAIN